MPPIGQGGKPDAISRNEFSYSNSPRAGVRADSGDAWTGLLRRKSNTVKARNAGMWEGENAGRREFPECGNSGKAEAGNREKGKEVCRGRQAGGERPQSVSKSVSQPAGGKPSAATQAAGDALQVDVTSARELGESRRSRDGRL